MKEAMERLDALGTELMNKQNEVDAAVLEKLARFAPLLEGAMVEISPGVRGIPLDEPAMWEYEAHRVVLTQAGYMRQDLLSRDETGHPSYFRARKDIWGGLVPVSAEQVARHFVAQDVIQILEGDLGKCNRNGAGRMDHALLTV